MILRVIDKTRTDPNIYRLFGNKFLSCTIADECKKSPIDKLILQNYRYSLTFSSVVHIPKQVGRMILFKDSFDEQKNTAKYLWCVQC